MQLQMIIFPRGSGAGLDSYVICATSKGARQSSGKSNTGLKQKGTKKDLR